GTGFTYHALPSVTALSTAGAVQGAAVTLTGYRFGATQGTSTATFNGNPATVLSWSDTSIRAVVPSTATSGNVVVRVNGESSPGVAFTVWAPPASNAAITAGGYHNSMKLDARGVPHVVHASAVDGANLLYTTYNPSTGGWSTATIDTNGRYRHPSIAIDTTGVLHVSAASGAGVRYLRCDPTGTGTACLAPASWTAVTAIPLSSGTCGPTSGTTSCADYTSIALTSANSPRIAYYDASDVAGNGCTDASTECLKFAAFAAAPPWTVEVVDPAPAGGTVGQFASLAIDPGTNQPHLSYYDGTGNKRSGNKNLVYATKAGSVWGYFSPATTNDVGHFTSIALWNGLPRISHTDITNSAKALDVTTEISLGAWSTAAVDSGGVSNVANGGTSIAVGTDGRARVAYYHGGTGSLRLAQEGAASWGLLTRTTGGFFPSLGLDGLNRGRVAYQNGTSLAFHAQ
ncbi:MAG TPA: IPT/TIG domain-containing protein, partial [Myxococcales bacterium]|nr:IPT/TIG domain-containing protein [Myxococcales bacterium]